MKKAFILSLLSVFMLASFDAAAQFGGGSYFSANSQARAAYINWLMYQRAKSNGDNLKKWWKSESTMAVAWPGPLKYTARTRIYDYNAINKYQDTAISGMARPKIGFSVNGNSNHMLARTGPSSIVTFSFGVEYSLYRWESDGFKDEKMELEDKQLTLLQLGMPLTIDYKSGCDVDFDANLRTCWAVGAGFCPSVVLTGYGSAGIGQVYTGIAPYLYGSFGMYAGILGCVKLRASVLPGQFHINGDNDGSGYITDNSYFQSKGYGLFTLGIAFMGHSRDWRNGSGWRTPAGKGGGGGGGGGRRRNSSFNMGGRMF